ncbi:hypothetical protein Prudu_019611, partial [Prunus dulcis]
PPPQGTATSGVGTNGTASTSPSRLDPSPPTSRPELIGKSRKPTEPPFSLNSQPNLASKAPEAKLNHRRDLQEVQLARTSITALMSGWIGEPELGRLCRIFGKGLREVGKKVICARHSPGVGHAQDLAPIPKWNWDRTLHSVHPRFLFKLGPNGGGVRKEIRQISRRKGIRFPSQTGTAP